MCTCVYLYARMCTYGCMFVYLWMHVCVPNCKYMYLYARMCTYGCMFVYLWIHVCVPNCKYVYLYARMCTYGCMHACMCNMYQILSMLMISLSCEWHYHSELGELGPSVIIGNVALQWTADCVDSHHQNHHWDVLKRSKDTKKVENV